MQIKKGPDGKSKGFGFVLMETFDDQMKVPIWFDDLFVLHHFYFSDHELFFLSFLLA